MRRLALRQLGGPKPRWKYTKARGLLVRDGKGGIDWWRHREDVLKPHLIPFALQRLAKRPDTILLEDGASCHGNKANTDLLESFGILKMRWPGNSPDLNAIEPSWAFLKRGSSTRGAPLSWPLLKDRWRGEWRAMPQSEIRRWIERLPENIAKIIALEGGNAYQEGETGQARLAAARKREQERTEYWRKKRQAREAGQEEQFSEEERRLWREQRWPSESQDRAEDVDFEHTEDISTSEVSQLL